MLNGHRKKCRGGEKDEIKCEKEQQINKHNDGETVNRTRRIDQSALALALYVSADETLSDFETNKH